MEGVKCIHHCQLAAVLRKPSQSINIAGKINAMMRCQELCGELKQECLDLVWQAVDENGSQGEDYPDSESGGSKDETLKV